MRNLLTLCRALALFVVAGILSCTMFEPASPQLIDLLPRETDIPGWLIRDRQTLDRNQIARENRVYGLFGADRCVRETVYSLSDESLSALIEIIQFPSPFHCFGLFSFERGFDTEFVESLEESYLTRRGMFLWKGDFYIKVTAPGREVPLKEYRVMATTALANISSLASTVKLPSDVYTFSDNYSTLDLVYYIQGHRLLPGSERVFVRKKVIFDETRYVFFIRYDTALAASEGYNAVHKKASPGFIVTKEGDLQMYFRQGDGDRLVFLSMHREHIFGVLNADSLAGGRRIMVKLFNDLTGYYK